MSISISVVIGVLPFMVEGRRLNCRIFHRVGRLLSARAIRLSRSNTMKKKSALPRADCVIDILPKFEVIMVDEKTK